MHSYVRPDQYVALRLPSEMIKIQQVTPNTYVQIPRTTLTFTH